MVDLWALVGSEWFANIAINLGWSSMSLVSGPLFGRCNVHICYIACFNMDTHALNTDIRRLAVDGWMSL